MLHGTVTVSCGLEAHFIEGVRGEGRGEGQSVAVYTCMAVLEN